MKSSCEHIMLVFILLLTVFFSWRSFAQHAPRRASIIKKAFHHRDTSTSACIEAGNCVLYLDEMPSIIPAEHVTIQGNTETHTFILPSSRIVSEECKRMVAGINKDKTQKYSISIVQQPSKSVSISMKWPRGMYCVDCKQFQAIGGDKGLVFSVYNQKTLDALRSRQEPLLQTVSTSRHPPRIFIDNGHGGGDAGAIGHKDVLEKNVCLNVGTCLAQLLQEQGYEVFMSRSTDEDVPLDARTTAANHIQADLLISIHANSASNTSASGVETFYMIPTLFKAPTQTIDRVSSLDIVDKIIVQRSHQSYHLAQCVQKNICTPVTMQHKPPVNRGIKHAVAQVFFAHMPAILVELGFLTNPEEAQLLASQTYQHLLAKSICAGICDYFNARLLT